MNNTHPSRRQWFALHSDQVLWGVAIVGAVLFAFTDTVLCLIVALVAAGAVITREASSPLRR